MFRKIVNTLPVVLATVAMSGLEAKSPSPSLASASYNKEGGQNLTVGASYRYALARQGNTLVAQVMTGDTNRPNQLNSTIYDAGSTYHSMFSVKAEMLMPEKDMHFSGISYDWLYGKQSGCHSVDSSGGGASTGTVWNADSSLTIDYQTRLEDFDRIDMSERNELNDLKLYYGRNNKVSRRFSLAFSGFVEFLFGKMSNQAKLKDLREGATATSADISPIQWTTDCENNLFYAGPGVSLLGEFYLREGSSQGSNCCSRVALYAGCSVSGIAGTSKLSHHCYKYCNGCVCEEDTLDAYAFCQDRLTEAKTRGWKPVVETRMGVSINPAMEDDNGMHITVGYWGRSYVGLGDWIRYNNSGQGGGLITAGTGTDAEQGNIENVVNIPQYDVNYSGLEVAFSYSF